MSAKHHQRWTIDVDDAFVPTPCLVDEEEAFLGTLNGVFETRSAALRSGLDGLLERREAVASAIRLTRRRLRAAEKSEARKG